MSPVLIQIYTKGDVKHDLVDHYYEGYRVYLHEKGQFWPSDKMEKLGQTEGLFIPLNTEQACKLSK